MSQVNCTRCLTTLKPKRDMKTPMQELISVIRKRQEDEDVQPFMWLEQIVELAESMLEKEKEVIIETSKNSYIAGYLDNQAKIDDSMNFSGEYYNAVFKNREK